MKAVTLTCGAGILGTPYTHYSSDVLAPGERLFTRSGNPIVVEFCDDNNEATCLEPMPAYCCAIKGVESDATVYDQEMLNYLNR